MEEQRSFQQQSQSSPPQQFSPTPNKPVHARHTSFWLKIIIALLVLAGGTYYVISIQQNSSHLLTLDTLLTQDKNYPAVETLATQLEQQYPDNVEVKLAKGEAEFNLKKYDEALQTYDQVIVLDPTNTTALYYKGIIPKIKNAVPAPALVQATTTTNVIESRLGVAFDHTILKFDSASSYAQIAGIQEAINATYESSQSVQDVAAYLSKILPQPVIFVSVSPAIEFHRVPSKTDPVSYVIRVEPRNGKTVISISYSKAKQ